MWICLNNGFLIVSEYNDDSFLIEALKEEHLKENFPYIQITKDAEYYSLIIEKIAFATWLFNFTMKDLNYTNFKNSVKNKQLNDFYCTVWSYGLSFLGNMFEKIK
jgi:hypothetical protein